MFFMAYIAMWRDHPDKILSDLSRRFLDRRPLNRLLLTIIPHHFGRIGTISGLYWLQSSLLHARNDAYDLPYDTISRMWLSRGHRLSLFR